MYIFIRQLVNKTDKHTNIIKLLYFPSFSRRETQSKSLNEAVYVEKLVCRFKNFTCNRITEPYEIMRNLKKRGKTNKKINGQTEKASYRASV